ncbi:MULTISPECIES: hypothetical protein [unclassified Clostridium]|uniref:hypothetical protein n=1 Tax=unclassified Clostridium TaxID=2614128 RepID=UPI0002979759|nr:MULTISPECIES: hypothetical protein [unclassified Clostridium]EKQ55070.1 MAG: hypothetical protein A370_02844 [Clostridium sp. Maddingley MBC34-26]
MNKLILLNEVKKEKNKSINNFLDFDRINNEQKDYNKSCLTFKEIFDFFEDKEGCIGLNNLNNKKYNKNENNLNKIMRRIFSLNNNLLLIKFINSIYNDELSSNTKIEFINSKENINNSEIIILNDSNYNLRILAEDEYKNFEYRIQFQTKDDNNLALVISKIDLATGNNIINFNKKKKEHEEYSIDNNLKEKYDKCLIMLNSTIEVPDIYEYKCDQEGENIDYKINIIKSWKYDFKQLFQKNMYLLFPIKALDLKQRLLSMSDEFISTDLIKDELIRFFRDMNNYLKKAEDINLITDKDINELNLITIDLLNYYITEKNNIFVDAKIDIEATLREIVV